jgi:hypothetical protein
VGKARQSWEDPTASEPGRDDTTMSPERGPLGMQEPGVQRPAGWQGLQGALSCWGGWPEGVAGEEQLSLVPPPEPSSKMQAALHRLA